MAPKAIRIDPNLTPELLASVRKSEAALERILGDAAERVEVSWDSGEPEKDGDRTVRLTLTDSGVTRSYEFFEWEFREDLHVRRKLHDLWDQVLVERIKIQRQRVLQSLAESGGE
jgi:hypothetical protein